MGRHYAMLFALLNCSHITNEPGDSNTESCGNDKFCICWIATSTCL